MKPHKLLLLLFTAWLIAGCATAFNGSSGGGGGPVPFSLTITGAPTSVQGSTTQQFSAKTSDGTAPSLTWSVNGVVGGDAVHGTITSTGLYTAPEFPPAPNGITISAVVTGDPNKSGSLSVTLLNPTPTITTVSPLTIPVGTFSLTITGAHFAQGATVVFGAVTLATTRISSTQLTATGTATSGEVGNVSISVTNPTPGQISSGGITAQVRGGIIVAVSPASNGVRAGSTQQFLSAGSRQYRASPITVAALAVR